VQSLRQGAPAGHGSVDVGAMIDPAQPAIVGAHLDDAVSKGATVLTGGAAQADGAGRFVAPTVLVDVDHSMQAMTEETFGPTIPIMKVRDADEAVRLANDSTYGLNASVWTQDAARGEEIARRLEAGAVCVNDAQLSFMALELPFGGWKNSGVGSRHGAHGIRKYCLEQAIVVNPEPPARDDHMYPYSDAVTGAIAGMLRDLYYG
jgi:acyl-CoA reductase-like NAD-dependent aldehyde dehydrogenase